MAHIDLPEGVPGILGPLEFRPHTAGPLLGLAEALLRTDEGLTRGERELIAARVSRLNRTRFCEGSHAAASAGWQVEGGFDTVAAVLDDPDTAPVSAKLRALLKVADQVAESGLAVRAESVEAARAEGATDLEIHDAVLIAAAFCMYNRYVDGLATLTPTDDDEYKMMGKMLADEGYLRGRV